MKRKRNATIPFPFRDETIGKVPVEHYYATVGMCSPETGEIGR